MYVCDVCQFALHFYRPSFSNKSHLDFTDEEVLAIYLFLGYTQRYFDIKSIHIFAREYLSSCFLKLSFYQTFNARLNTLLVDW